MVFNIAIEGIRSDHSVEQLVWICSEFDKFLQTDTPKKDIFHLVDSFGMRLIRFPEYIKVEMVYAEDETQMQNKALPKP